VHHGYVAFLFFFPMGACGARSSLETSGPAGGAGGVGSSKSSTGTAALCDPAGIRLCKNPECPLAPGACPGLGCTPSADRETGAPETTGVCWDDIPTFVTEQCSACKGDQVCVHRSSTELVCVPFAVCDALYKLGAGAACRYGDKSPFTDEPIAQSPVCPPGHDYQICGGACGDCLGTGGYADRCVGRSASRPIGICTDGMPYLCSFKEDGTAIQPCADAVSYCAIFKLAPPDDVYARLYGVCVGKAACVADAQVTPLLCLGSNGTDHAM